MSTINFSDFKKRPISNVDKAAVIVAFFNELDEKGIKFDSSVMNLDRVSITVINHLKAVLLNAAEDGLELEDLPELDCFHIRWNSYASCYGYKDGLEMCLMAFGDYGAKAGEFCKLDRETLTQLLRAFKA